MEDREMYPAVCADCGSQCEVPFEPTEGKPVRCRECFQKNRPKKRFNSPRRFDDRPREMHKATCAECGNECEVPFKPTEGRDVFCKNCYAKQRD